MLEFLEADSTHVDILSLPLAPLHLQHQQRILPALRRRELLHPARLEYADCRRFGGARVDPAGVRFLAARPGGRLLDVGCGSGDWLMFMRGLGWQVSGNDFDANAVKTAQGRGLDVECASLEQQKHASGTFDAVTLSHVIEHVPDPVRTLAECRRILKPGGKLVLFTPNASSLSHRVFKNDWRGLEPPRHLHVFSTESMRPLLERAGFQNISVRPHLARSVVYESLLLRRGRTSAASQTGRNWSAEAYARLFNLVELCLIQWKPSVADCVAAVAVKE